MHIADICVIWSESRATGQSKCGITTLKCVLMVRECYWNCPGKPGRVAELKLYNLADTLGVWVGQNESGSRRILFHIKIIMRDDTDLIYMSCCALKLGHRTWNLAHSAHVHFWLSCAACIHELRIKYFWVWLAIMVSLRHFWWPKSLVWTFSFFFLFVQPLARVQQSERKYVTNKDVRWHKIICREQ